jgi:putative tryptophan/tyrosine transport system substrate-binding protein
VRRREFIAGLGSTTVWPVVGRAQQIDRTRRVGVLMGWSEGNSEYRSYLAAFIEELAALGWPTGSLQIEQRWTDGNIDRARILAKQIVELQPDVILSATTPVTTAVQRETRAVPVVFVVVSDPVGAGFTESLSRPGGNFTGFINIEASMVGKQLGILKEIAPDIKRALIMFNPDTAPGAGRYFLDSFRIAAQSLEIEPIEVQVRSDFEIESAIHLIRERTGLVVMTDSFMGVHLGTVISSEARNIVPAIFEGP